MVDFAYFIKNNGIISNDINDVGHLMHTGLYSIYYEQINVNVEDEHDKRTLRGGSKYRSDVDGGVYVDLSHAATIILKIFSKSSENK